MGDNDLNNSRHKWKGQAQTQKLVSGDLDEFEEVLDFHLENGWITATPISTSEETIDDAVQTYYMVIVKRPPIGVK
jgi:hypothetical protein